MKKLHTVLLLLPLAKQAWKWYNGRKHENKQHRLGD